MKGATLSRVLRHESDPFLARRRAIAALSLTAIGAMGLISLYQLGLMKHLPEPPLPHFDADRVDAAPEAYQYLAMPDGVLGLGSYAATLGLAAMGGPNRATEQPFTRTQAAVSIPDGVDTVTIEGRDKANGYGGKTTTVPVPQR